MAKRSIETEPATIIMVPTVMVKVQDRLNRDGQEFGPGDEIEMPEDEATRLSALGVVAFVAPAAPLSA